MDEPIMNSKVVFKLKNLDTFMELDKNITR